MSNYYSVSAQRRVGENHNQTNWKWRSALPRFVIDCLGRRTKHISGRRSFAGRLIVALALLAPQASSQTLDAVSVESSNATSQEGGPQNPSSREIVPDALIQQLSAKWRAEAMAGTNNAQMSENHRALLVDALSRVNWTPFCSYIEESIGPDEKEPRIRHHTVEFNQDALTDLINQAAEATNDFDGDTEFGGSGGFETSLDEFAGMREDLAAAKVISASELFVIYELPVPSEILEENADPEDMGNMERRFMKRLMANLRVLFTVDAQNRGPKDLRVELLKPVRVFPGVKMKKVSFATNFRYLEDIREFAADRNASEMSIRAFLVAGFSESESKTLSDFRCVQKG